MSKIEDKDLQRFFDKINSGPGGVKQPAPAFQRYRKQFLRDFDWNAIKKYSPEQIIQSARTQEELIIIGEFLQKEWGRDHWWWKLYHYKRIQLGYLPSFYGVTKVGTPEMKTVWGAPVNPQEYLRYKNLAGPQAVAVDRRMFSKLASYQQITGQKPLFNVVQDGDGPKLKSWTGLKAPKLPSNISKNAMVFDIEATGLLGKEARIVSMGLQDLHTTKTKSWFAEFDTSKKHAEFIEQVIYPQWKRASAGQTILSEKALIENAISSFEAPKATIMGYNIKSYDIPLLYERAKTYGLHTRFEKAVSQAQIIDVAEHAQAFISSQVGGKYLGWQEGDLGLKPLGWKLETVAESLGYTPTGLAHEASEDVAMTKFVWEKLSKSNIKQSKQVFQQAVASGKFEESVYKHTGKRLLQFTPEMGKIDFSAQMLPEKEYIKPFTQYISDFLGVAPKAAKQAIPGPPKLGFIGRVAKSDIGKTVGGIARYAGTFTAMNLIMPGDFATNAVSSAFFDIARYGAKKKGVTGWKGIAAGIAGAGVFRLGQLAYNAIRENQSEFGQIEEHYKGMSDVGRINLKERFALQEEAKTLFNQEPENVKAEFGWFNRALKEYGQASGTGHKRILIPKNILNEQELEKDLGFMEVDIAIPEAGQARSESFRHPRLKHHIHDFSDVWTMHEDEYHSSTMMIERAKLRGENSLISEAYQTAKGLPHVVTEGIPGLYYYLKGKVTGTPSMKERLEQELSPSYLKAVGLQPAPKENRFSGRDDAYNTIEGLRHGGLAEVVRKDMTEFGSGWDRLKAVATNMFKELGEKEAFKRLRKSEMFKSALKEATEVGELSSGSYGTTYLMEGTLRGEKFRFIKKLPESELSEQFAAFNPNVPNRAKRIAALKEEHKAMPLVEEGISPNVYGYNKEENALYMELMPGKTLHELLLEGENVNLAEMRVSLKDTIKRMAEKGVKNTDIHTGNIMLDPETRKMSWIDWGLAKLEKNPSQAWVKEAQDEMEAAAEQKLFTVIEQSTSNKASKVESFFDDWGSLNSAASKSPEMPKTAFNSLALNRTIPNIDALAITEPGVGFNRTVPIPQFNRSQQFKRMKRFNNLAKQSVGLGHRAAKNAGRKHSQFASTRRG